ncbi:MAG: M20/M25/M40 family metallo-hydrolase, partial [Anaerolineae bacterium]|nr:M20/M25/M40 family metallo-hydrolase [Anaerolineae bacterium]
MHGAREIAIQYFKNHEDEYLEDLVSLLNIPSISTDTNMREMMMKAAKWLENKLHKIGFQDVSIYPTKGAPVVIGEYRAPSHQATTLLIYGHYDVQPVDPIELWKSDPFDAKREGELLIARGASDMKGQLLAVLAALDSILSNGPLDINVKVIFEGEEESGSPNLEAFIQENRELLACDIILN